MIRLEGKRLTAEKWQPEVPLLYDYSQGKQIQCRGVPHTEASAMWAAEYSCEPTGLTFPVRSMRTFTSTYQQDQDTRARAS